MARPRRSPLRLGLIGGECTGKTTLAAALASRLPGCLVDEALRELVAREGRPPVREEQAALLADQQAREEAVAHGCRQPWLVADPAPLMTAVYSRLYFDDDTLTASAVEHARGYALVVWCADDLPWTADGAQRDGPEFRSRADAIIDDLVRVHLAPRGIDVLRVHGSVQERLEQVGRAWQPRPPHPPT